MRIDLNTRISSILKFNPQALDAIVSINPRFEKLRNPVLRKLLAGRATIAMACQIAAIEPQEFFDKLAPLGFTTDHSINRKESVPMTKDKELNPPFPTDQVISLDVRPVLAGGNDPLQMILEKIRQLRAGEVLLIINTFQPSPLISLLGKQGYRSHVDIVSENLVHAYFYKPSEMNTPEPVPQSAGKDDWDSLMLRFAGNMVVLDVRALEMPQPMMSILAALDSLPADQALFVHHKRVPLFLLPELEERSLSFRIRELGESDVQMLIFHD